MARSLFGGRVGDTVASLYNLGNRQVFTLPVDANGDPSSVTLQVWDAPDGTQLTDLLAADGTTPITVVTVPSSGQVPEFYGPDGVNVAVYVKDPDDDFYRLDARADAAAQAAADAQAAAETAAAAAEAVGSTNDAIIAGRIDDPASLTASSLSASFVASDGPSPRFSNVFEGFFSNGSLAFQTGQSTTNGVPGVQTTLSAAAASGATTLAVTSAAGLVVGTSIVVNATAANASLHKITAIAGTSLTVTPALPAAAASGSPVVTLWSSAGHLTDTGGYQAFWRWVLTRTNPDGSPVFNPAPGDKIVLLANSWGAQSATVFGSVVNALWPTAVPVNLGVGGNTSAQLLARFDTDVPTDAAYVIFNEPGVNDATALTNATTEASNIDALVAKIRALDAVPVYTGPVPFNDSAANGTVASSLQQARAKAQAARWAVQTPGVTLGDVAELVMPASKTALSSVALGSQAQSQSSGTENTAVGVLAQYHVTTGGNNTAIGSNAQRSLTTGSGNTAIGTRAHELLTTGGNNVAIGSYAQSKATTGGQNVSIGQRAHRELTTGANGTAVGWEAGASVTTGPNNTFIGSDAGYAPNNATANATTTAQGQTVVGFQSGQASTTQADYITTLGYRALGGDNRATAIGYLANAAHTDSVALGANTATSGNSQVNIGQRYFEMSELTGEPVNPAADKGRLFFLDNGAGKTRLGVRFSTGSTIWLATEA